MSRLGTSACTSPEKSSDTTPIGFLTFAESYGRAAVIVAQAVDRGARLPFPAPVGHLALHCVELSLKGVLSKKGMKASEIKNQFRHGLAALFDATSLDWSAIPRSEIDFYDYAVRSTALRYRHPSVYFIMENARTLAFMENVFLQ